MKACRICAASFDPRQRPNDPEVQAGLFMAQQDYGDAEQLCNSCLASRGRLAMMYRYQTD